MQRMDWFKATAWLRGATVLAILAVASMPAAVPAMADQDAAAPYEILVKSGTFTPTAGDYAAGLSYLAQHADAGGAHLLVQLYEIPTVAAREELASRGITLLRYLPQRTWLAQVSSAMTGSALRAAGVRWLGPLELAQKVSERVLNADYATWSEYDGGWRIYAIEMHADVAKSRGEELLRARGAVFGGHIRALNAFIAALDPREITELALQDEVSWISERPPVLTGVNDGIREAIGVNTVQAPPYGLDGFTANVLVYDVGLIGSHPDFGSRVTAGEGGGVASHSTHVGGTVGGDGTNSGGTYKGMAPRVKLTSYLYEACSPNCLYNSPQDIEENYEEGMLTFRANLASNSLGSNIASNGYPCSWEGDYETTAQLLDAICQGSLGRPFLSVWAAGNERHNGRCGTGYSTTGVPATAKNTIVVGATMSNDHSMSWFSSWGPVDDGRLRPDVCAPGCQSGGDGGITSTLPGGSYGAMCGTSMATPATAGVLALVLQQLHMSPGGILGSLPSTLKAVLINTAYDYGNPGPDFQFGYGEIRAPAAVDVIRNKLALKESLIDQGGEQTYEFEVEPGLLELRATVAWSDVPGQQLAQLELVNDLDIYFESPSGATHRPWILDHTNPSALATRGIDHRNPVEQVLVSGPEAGIWTLHVIGYSVPQGPQLYSLVANLPLFTGASDIAETSPDAGAARRPLVRVESSRPNPFHGSTMLRYTLDQAGTTVVLNIRDVTGRVVRTLADQPSTAGMHEVGWDGRDGAGSALPAGVYFYSAGTAGTAEHEGSGRLLLIR